MIKEVVLLSLLSVEIAAAQSINLLGEEYSIVLLLPLAFMLLILVIFLGVYIKDKLQGRRDRSEEGAEQKDSKDEPISQPKEDKPKEKQDPTPLPNVNHKANLIYFQRIYKKLSPAEAMQNFSKIVNAYLKDTFGIKGVFSYEELKNKIPQYGEVLSFTDSLSDDLYSGKPITSLKLNRLILRYKNILHDYPPVTEEISLSYWDKLIRHLGFFKKKEKKPITKLIGEGVSENILAPSIQRSGVLGPFSKLMEAGSAKIEEQKLLQFIGKGKKEVNKNILNAKKYYTRALLSYYRLPAGKEKKFLGRLNSLYEEISKKSKDKRFSSISRQVLKSKVKRDKRRLLKIVKNIMGYFQREEHDAAISVYRFLRKLKRFEHNLLESIEQYSVEKEKAGKKLLSKEERAFLREVHLLSYKIQKRKEDSVKNTKRGIDDLLHYSTSPVRFIGRAERQLITKGNKIEKNIVRQLGLFYSFLHSEESKISNNINIYHRKIRNEDKNILDVIKKDEEQSINSIKRLFHSLRGYEEGFVATSLKYLRKQKKILKEDERLFILDINMILASIRDKEQDSVKNIEGRINEVLFRSKSFVDTYHNRGKKSVKELDDTKRRGIRFLRRNEYQLVKKAKKIVNFLENKKTRIFRLIKINEQRLIDEERSMINDLKTQTRLINQNENDIKKELQSYINEHSSLFHPIREIHLLERINMLFSNVRRKERNIQMDYGIFRESILREINQILDSFHKIQEQTHQEICNTIPDYIEKQEKKGVYILTNWERSFVDYLRISKDSMESRYHLEKDKTQNHLDTIFHKVRSKLEDEEKSGVGYLQEGEKTLLINLRRLSLKPREEALIKKIKSLRKMEEDLLEKIHPPDFRRVQINIQREIQSVEQKITRIENKSKLMISRDINSIKRLHLKRKIKSYINILEGNLHQVSVFEKVLIDDMRYLVDYLEGKVKDLGVDEKVIMKRMADLIVHKSIYDGLYFFTKTERGLLRSIFNLEPKEKKVNEPLEKLGRLDEEEEMIKKRLARLEHQFVNILQNQYFNEQQVKEDKMQGLTPMKKYLKLVRKEEELREKWGRIHKMN